ncbi:histidinol dehydrogenase [Buchnera aphidicola]|uniref:Histidinol dehydrogenase n=1 Tax=Buchnera aphidicola (Stegophylla sp.) TaxID=2315800 RepID=A0A4D6YES1_9GAMM|nr:histidinol dehydrogenase [Buchnera aphidicola (Stegophylla sp.)]
MLLENKIIYWNDLNSIQQKNMLLRPNIQRNHVKQVVKDIISDVRNLRDEALQKYTNKFDNVQLDSFKVSQDRINKSEFLVDEEFKKSVLLSFKNIYKFHSKQNMNMIDINIQTGIRCQQIVLPIESIGLYVPGGVSPLFSTVLMLSIPAVIAGCKNIILCSPPPIVNEILYVAKMCGINNIFEIGGAQSIAALAFGTETIPKVNKIFGPGNVYVTEAKLQLNQLLTDLSIDMTAGPSELVVIADHSANPIFIASDLLSQLEHGYDTQVMLLTCNHMIAEKVLTEMNKQILNLSRKSIILSALENSRFIVTNNLIDCIGISNSYAPEHLSIQTENSRYILSKVLNAGSIFLGHWSPEAVGDYISGPNHVLPTYGSAIVSSGLSVLDFQKRISVQELTSVGLKSVSHAVMCLSMVEKMDAHSNAIIQRMNFIKNRYED